jgi:hypothetical protein
MATNLEKELRMGDFKNAGGVIPWKEGDKLPEEVIRRLRDSDPADEIVQQFAEENQRLRELLKQMEWYWDASKQRYVCLICGAEIELESMNWGEPQEHDEGCELEEELKNHAD